MSKKEYSQINIRVTKEEKEALQKGADSLKIKLSQYTRNLLFDDREVKEKELSNKIEEDIISIQNLEKELEKYRKKIEELEENFEENIKNSTFYTNLYKDFEVVSTENRLLLEQVADLKNDKTELYRLFDQQQQLINSNKFALPTPKKSLWARLLGR